MPLSETLRSSVRLSDFTRQQIEAFLAAIGVTPQHDATNTDRRYLRNRIRHELIPLLENNYNPNIRTGLSRTADVLGAESEYLDTIALAAFEACRLSDMGKAAVSNRCHTQLEQSFERITSRYRDGCCDRARR